MITTITLNGASVSVVTLPTSAALRSVEFSVMDAVGVVSSPFTGQTQTQQWPGADMWSGTMTLPPLTQDQADDWISCLMEMRGMANPIQIGDPLKAAPRGERSGSPIVDSTVSVVPGGQTLYMAGWTPSRAGLLLPGDYVQLGYRLHRVLDPVNSDGSGNASVRIWPSLREVPTTSLPLILENTVGLFRLATNKRTWSADFTGVTHLSFQLMEYR